METIYRSLLTDIGKKWPDLEVVFGAKNEHHFILHENPFFILEMGYNDFHIQLRYAIRKTLNDDLSFKELVIETEKNGPYYYQYENSQNGEHIYYSNSNIITHLETAFKNYT